MKDQISKVISCILDGTSFEMLSALFKSGSSLLACFVPRIGGFKAFSLDPDQEGTLIKTHLKSQLAKWL
jgi:hypothetical protein